MSNDLTSKEFRLSALAVLDRHEKKYRKSLEDYLLSLWTVIEKKRENHPSYSLFVAMIDEAFESPSCDFDEQWLAKTKPLLWDYQNGSCVIQEYQNGELTVTTNNVDSFEILQHTVLFQIADLHRIPTEKINNSSRYFGVDSPTGEAWYNFDAITYWECAMSGMEDHINAPQSFIAHLFTKRTWAVLATLLSLGRVYE